MNYNEVEFTEPDNVSLEMEEMIIMVRADSFHTQYFRDRLSPGKKEVDFFI